MSQAEDIETDFAAEMQELSAQAAAHVVMSKDEATVANGMSVMLSAVHSLGQRLEALEETVVRNFESLQLKKFEEQLSAIRDSETVNQKLFDSLHQELISYRDNFVRESLQKPVIRDLLVLFDDLSAISAQFEEAAAAKKSRAEDVRARDNLQNMLHFLLEILHRLEVNELELKETVDLSLHRVVSFEAAESAEEAGQIVRRTKRGFMWRDRLLRPEEVVAKRFQ